MTKKLLAILPLVVLILGLLSPAQAYEIIVHGESISLYTSADFVFQTGWGYFPPNQQIKTDFATNYYFKEITKAMIDFNPGDPENPQWQIVGSASASAHLGRIIGSSYLNYSLSLDGFGPLEWQGAYYGTQILASGNILMLFSVAKEAGDTQNTVPVSVEIGAGGGAGTGIAGFIFPARFSAGINPGFKIGSADLNLIGDNANHDSKIINLNVGDLYTLNLSLSAGPGYYSLASEEIDANAYFDLYLPLNTAPPLGAAPLPGAIFLLGSGLGCLAVCRRRKLTAIS